MNYEFHEGIFYYFCLLFLLSTYMIYRVTDLSQSIQFVKWKIAWKATSVKIRPIIKFQPICNSNEQCDFMIMQ